MLSRFCTPKTDSSITRPRLLDQLQQVNDQSIIWIHGSPGSGKTVLSASFVNSLKEPALWNQLDLRDSDETVFLANLCAAGQHLYKPGSELPPPLTPEYALDIAIFARHYFERLFAALPRPCWIVLDNYETLDAYSGSHDLLSIGLGLLPPGIRVIITSRQHPPAVFSRLRANGMLTTIDPSTLLFTLNESRQLIQTALGTNGELSESWLESVYRHTHGWAAGLILCSKPSIQKLPTESNESTQSVFDYFSQEVFYHMDKRTQLTLLKTAYLSDVTQESITALGGNSEDFRAIELLSSQNYFTTHLGDERPKYRYHPMFRNFLIKQANVILSSEELAEVIDSSAELLNQSGQLSEALELWCKLENYPSMAQALSEQANHLLMTGQAKTLVRLIRQLPEDWISENPDFLSLLGIAILPSSPFEALTYFEQSFAAAKRQVMVHQMLLAVAGVMECIGLQRANFSRLDEWIAILDQLLDQSPNLLTHPAIAPQLIPAALFAISWRQPDYPKLPQLKKLANEMLGGDYPIIIKMKLGNAIMVNSFWLGDYHTSQRLEELLQHCFHSPEATPLVKLVFGTMTTVTSFMGGKPVKCKQEAARTYQFGQATGIHLMDSPLLSYQAISHFLLGDLSRAEQILDNLAPLVSAETHPDNSHFHFARGWFAHAQGRLLESLGYYQFAVTGARISGAPAPQAICLIGQAQLLISMNRYDEAQAALDSAKPCIRPFDNNILLFRYELAEAELAKANGNDALAIKILKQCLRRGEQRQFVCWFGLIPHHLSPLLLLALRENIATSYVHSLIRQYAIEPPTGEIIGDLWPWPIKICSLGEFQVAIDDRVLTEKELNRHKKPLELLMVLVAMGGQSIHQERLSDALWPEAEGDAARKNFDTTLYRLRKLIGNQALSPLQDSRLSLNSKVCWVDLHEFLHLATQHRQKPMIDVTAFTPIWSRISDLYLGPFLQDANSSSWALATRKQAHDHFLRLASYASDIA
ncbi:MAG: hypothetical protein OEY09_03105 [Gammaproteobacteria bacterium]|nr:hypothetical protein [Gammaproteobacteria bacterium]